MASSPLVVNEDISPAPTNTGSLPGEGVVVTVVSDGPEADVVCGLLQSAGIDCAYRDTEAIDSALEDFTAAGPREILVRDSDVEAARALLADSAAD